MDTGGTFPRHKAAGDVADHLCAEHNEWRYTSTPPYSLMGVHGDNFALSIACQECVIMILL